MYLLAESWLLWHYLYIFQFELLIVRALNIRSIYSTLVFPPFPTYDYIYCCLFFICLRVRESLECHELNYFCNYISLWFLQLSCGVVSVSELYFEIATWLYDTNWIQRGEGVSLELIGGATNRGKFWIEKPFTSCDFAASLKFWMAFHGNCSLN